MAEIDTLLSNSLKRLAQPGDAAGVADAIRSRVDAGDTGTPAQSSGFGGGSPLSWLPWVGLVVVAGLVGGSLAPLGVFGAVVTEVATAETAMLPDDATAYLCIEGAEAAQLPAGQRVLAVGRSDDSTWLGVRDPLNAVATLWLPAGSVVLDAGQDAAALPVGGDCPTIETTLAVPVAPAPAPGPTTPPAPGPNPGPNPGPSDTTPPAIVQWGATLPEPSGVCRDLVGETATLYALTSDNVAVTSVAISWSGVASGSSTMAGSGNSWTFEYDPPPTTPFGDLVFTMIAFDAAGNDSEPRTAKVSVLDCPF